MGVQGKEENNPESPWTCELRQVVEGGQRGRWWQEQIPVLDQLTVLDQLLCLLPQPGRFHLGLFQKLPWKEWGKEGQEKSLSSVRGFSPPCAPKPAPALESTPPTALWLSGTHHSSPQLETGRGPCDQGRRGGGKLGQTPGPWPPLPAPLPPQLAGTPQKARALLSHHGTWGPPIACVHSQGQS